MPISFKPDASFDGLAPTSTKGDLIVRTTVGSTALAVGSDNTVLTADSAQASGVKWASAATNFGVVNLTGATTLSSWNTFVNVSGTTFAVTLPSTAGAGGGQIVFRKTDAGYATPISVKGITTTQTIDGALGVTLQTQFEQFTFFTDGSYISINAHYWNGGWTTGASLTPNAGAFGTVTSGFFKEARDGCHYLASGYFKFGTVGGSQATVALPPGIMIDSSAVGSTSLQTIAGTWVEMLSAAQAYGSGNAIGPVAINPAGLTQLYISQRGLSLYMEPSVGNNGVLTSNSAMSFDIRFPVVGWKG